MISERYHEIRLCPSSLAEPLLVPHDESASHRLSPHRFLGTNFVFGEISLWTSNLKTLLPLKNHNSNHVKNDPLRSAADRNSLGTAKHEILDCQ